MMKSTRKKKDLRRTNLLLVKNKAAGKKVSKKKLIKFSKPNRIRRKRFKNN